MRLPFVSREHHEALVAELRAALAESRSDFTAERARHDDLFAKYDALKQSGAVAPATQVIPDSPYGQFGPLTRAALLDMGQGQSGPIKRAMQAKALTVWQDNRGSQNVDEVTAIAVRTGEQVWRP